MNTNYNFILRFSHTFKTVSSLSKYPNHFYQIVYLTSSKLCVRILFRIKMLKMIIYNTWLTRPKLPANIWIFHAIQNRLSKIEDKQTDSTRIQFKYFVAAMNWALSSFNCTVVHFQLEIHFVTYWTADIPIPIEESIISKFSTIGPNAFRMDSRCKIPDKWLKQFNENWIICVLPFSIHVHMLV